MKLDARIILISAFVAAVLLLAVVFRGCDETHLNNENKDQVRRTVTDVNDYLKKKDSVIDSLQQIIVRSNYLLSKVGSEKTAVERERAALRNKASALLADLKYYTAQRDTVAMVTGCDTLQQMAEDAIQQSQHYEQLFQAQQYFMDQKDSAQVAQLAVSEQKADTLQKTVMMLQKKYYDLDKSYLKLRRKNKRERTLSRVLAAGALVLGGILITK